MASNIPGIDPMVLEELEQEGVQDKGVQDKGLTVEQLCLLINTDRVRFLEERIKTEFEQLKDRQEKVRSLHDFLKFLNENTDPKGSLDLGKILEGRGWMEQAKQHGVDLDPAKKNYTKEERDRLVENVRMTIEDYNVQNDMQLQTITRLTNERYETYQMARSILKPLHEDKINKARGIAR